MREKVKQKATRRKATQEPQERRKAVGVKNDLPRAMRALLTVQGNF